MVIDYRCAISGLSLMGAETMAVVLASRDGQTGTYVPCALPLFGTYDGSGSLVEVSEGPNAEAILGAFNRDLEQGLATVEWTRFSLQPMALDHIETWLGLLRANAIHELDAVSWRGYRLDLAFFESHVAAAHMQAEPQRLFGVPVDKLPQAVFFDHPLASRIYEAAFECGPQLRCKYGLSLVAFASLWEALGPRGADLDGPGYAYPLEASQGALWLAEAYRDLGADEALLEALDDYTSALAGGEDDPAS